MIPAVWIRVFPVALCRDASYIPSMNPPKVAKATGPYPYGTASVAPPFLLRISKRRLASNNADDRLEARAKIQRPRSPSERNSSAAHSHGFGV